ncbi:hypothetical protein [Rugosimonospora africana]|uniref:Uncharacterized protein n=1 Tax=Rugosimonospora africana TaxID=556532 RepID=A0A8J3R329_9ACTN|nr:hypothetical protein [Rugosimonospora africana]GIH20768.1 hypothetical protein Raf01_89400 [Rugosimonospora africana]
MSYLGSGDPARRRTDYSPPWLADLADDVTMEGAVLNGIVRGADAVRTLLAYARTLYEYQDFAFAGAYGDNGYIEDYSSHIQSQPVGNIAVIYRNDQGKTQHVVMNHRPLPAVLLFSRLMGEHFKDTPYAEFFAAPE